MLPTKVVVVYPFAILLNLKQGIQILNKWRGVTILLQMGGQGHPTPIHTRTLTHKHTQKVFKMRIFPLSDSIIMDQWTDWRMDGPTDKASYWVACPQLKMVLDPCHILGLDHAWMIVNLSESMQGSSPHWPPIVLLTQGRILIEHVQLNADDWDLFKMVRRPCWVNASIRPEIWFKAFQA